MREDDFLFGARSGIQKAVRRGDLDLGKTCFDALWGNKTHRAWLKWRTPVLVLEECSYFIGELAKHYDKDTEDEKEWRRFIYELIVSPKCNEGTGLIRAVKAGIRVKSEEVSFLKKWYSKLRGDANLVLVVGGMMAECFTLRKFSSYEVKAAKFMLRRSGMGGWLGDRQLCMSNMAYLFKRGLEEDEVRSFIDKAVGKYLEESGKPRILKELPWYVFDMHTVIGKIALSILERRKISKWKISRDQLFGVWFLFESGRIPTDKMDYVGLKDDPTPFEAMWQIPSIKMRLKEMGFVRPAKELLAFWKEKILPEVKSTVEWVIKKREEKED